MRYRVREDRDREVIHDRLLAVLGLMPDSVLVFTVPGLPISKSSVQWSRKDAGIYTPTETAVAENV